MYNNIFIFLDKDIVRDISKKILFDKLTEELSI